MYRDPRGGHNRKVINEHFFKKWSPQMAYILGLLFADGAIEDVRRSSRTCYIQLSNEDKGLLEAVRSALSSKHRIYERDPQAHNFYNGIFISAKLFYLRIGNKIMYQDLTNLGLTPRKSLTMKFPKISPKYLQFFLRGYFDGDGCISIHTQKGRTLPSVRIIFTSGSYDFLKSLARRLSKILEIGETSIGYYSGAFRLNYRKREGLKILKFCYKDLNASPYLPRKYKKFISALS